MNQVLISCKDLKSKLVEVSIDHGKVELFAEEISKQATGLKKHIDLFSQKWDIEERLIILMAFNSMNFCFWAEKDQPKWTVSIEGKEYDGSLALFLLIEHIPELQTIESISKLSLKQFKSICKGNVQIPMAEERYKNLQNMVSVLKSRYKGGISELLESGEHKADKILQLLVTDFQCFQDESVFRGKKVYYWKRAQLQVKMMYDATRDSNKKITNIEYLTAFADYKIPQLLRHLGIISYLPKLARVVDSYKIIPKDSVIENEIRIATILAVESIKERLVELGVSITACEVDNILWNRATTNKDKMAPYHRTYTSAY